MTDEQKWRMGLRIRDTRIQRNLRLDELADALGITRSHLANMERARRMPSLEMIVSIAERLNVSLDYLVLGKTEAIPSRTLVLRSDEELSQEYMDAIESILAKSVLEDD